MSDYVNKLKQEKKIELSRKVSLSIANDIWEMSLMVKDADEFVDYLMTITDQDAIEEFFNKCHDEGGRFCGGSSGGRGPGTHKPAPIHYVKQQVREKARTTAERMDSAPLSKVTTSPGRRAVDMVTGGLGFNPSGFGTVKIRKLQRANLADFRTKDLQTLKTRLQASQRQYNNMHTMGYAGAALSAVAIATAKSGGNVAIGGLSLAGAAYQIGYARWKTKRIPAQIERIDRALAKRSKLTADGAIELALDDSNLPTLAQEIAAAKKELEGGKFEKPGKLSPEAIKDVENLIADIEDDDDATSEQTKAIKEFFVETKKLLK